MKTVYHLKTDRWVPVVPCLFFAGLAAAAKSIGWIAFVIFFVGFGALFVLMIFGTRYVIDDSRLAVYRFFRPRDFSIDSIRKIERKGKSRKKIIIAFSDKSVMKGYMPLIVYPDNASKFVGQLLEINPNIEVSFND